jgi:hypothetical protein
MDFTKITEVLRKTLTSTQLGVEILYNKQILKAVLYDLLPGFLYKKERDALLKASSFDEWKIIFEANNVSSSISQETKQQILIKMQSEEDTHELWNNDFCSKLLECFIQAFSTIQMTVENTGFSYWTQDESSYNEDKPILESNKKFKPFDIIRFGKYDWVILNIWKNQAIVLSKDILSFMKFNNSETKVTWKNSELRKWLNIDFYNSFTDIEKQAFLSGDTTELDIEKDNTPFYETKDKVFLLSIKAALSYFYNKYDISKSEYTEFKYNMYWDYEEYKDEEEKTKINETSIAHYMGFASSWWLRSPALLEEYTATVNSYGIIDFLGSCSCIDNPDKYPNVDPKTHIAATAYCGVRPAITIDISAIEIEYSEENDNQFTMQLDYPFDESKYVIGNNVCFDKFKWRVLDIVGKKALLLFDDPLFKIMSYDGDSGLFNTNCSINDWLNNDFYNYIFLKNQKRIISNLTNYDNTFDFSNTNNSPNAIFLLSEEEFKKYCVTNDDAMNISLINTPVIGIAYYKNGFLYEKAKWWLSSIVHSPEIAPYVNEDGQLSYTDYPNQHELFIRPALWINISNDISTKTITIGSETYIQFGEYKWTILSKQENRVLLITENVICTDISFGDTYQKWDSSNLRNWLNRDFFTKFSDDEQAKIIPVVNQTKENVWTDIDGCKDTSDYVFLLSIDEAIEYFCDKNISTEFTPGSLISHNDDSRRTAYYNNTPAWWWLRTPGRTDNKTATVFPGGYIDIDGKDVTYKDSKGGLRPAMWLQI